MKGNQKMITNDDVMNQIEEKSQEIHRLEDELREYGLDYVPFKDLNFESLNEINNDSPGWGTVILAFLAGWFFGD